MLLVVGTSVPLVVALALALRRHRVVADEFGLSLAWAGLGLLGALAFVAWFLHPRLGLILSWAVLLVAVVDCGRRWAELRRWWRQSGSVRQQVGLLAGVLLLYLGYLHLAPGAESVDTLAANRMLTGLPIDNTLPRLFATRLLDGVSPQVLHADWLSSDRPPLQTGLILLLYPGIQMSAAGIEQGAQAVGMLFQLWWIPATWSFARMLGLRRQRAVITVVVLAATPTLLIHSLYVWPKLGAAAAVLTSVTLWITQPQHPMKCCAATAVCVCLAWLAHGGCVFSLLAGLPWLAYGRWPHRRSLALCGLIGVVLCGSWLLYQKGYEPPGNRLLKWHLAGVEKVDDRSTGEALRDAYGQLTWSEIVDHKSANLRFPFYYGVSQWWRWPDQSAVADRPRAFYFLFAALGPLNLAWPAVGWLVLRDTWRRWRGRRDRQVRDNRLGHVVAWSALTYVVWALLLFAPASTTLHQGSLALPLVVSLVLLVGAWRIHRSVALILAIWIIGRFILIWLPPLATNPAYPALPAQFLLGLGGAILVAIAIPRPDRQL